MDPLYPLNVFSHCPRCASTDCGAKTIKNFVCRNCGFQYYQNAAAAVIAVIQDSEGRVLFTRREREPSKGKLDLPGGFVDPLETAETALAREVLEEVGIVIATMSYLTSFINRYDYLGVTYYTLDLVFRCAASDLSPLTAKDEVEAVQFLFPTEVDREAIGFESVRNIIQLLRNERSSPET